MSYACGDTEQAAERLRLLAETFARPTTAFLRASVTAPPALAVDLGCGPGWSTHLLAETLNPELTVGLDNSERFIALARKTASARVSFSVHDVASVPFPVGPADLIFCRFLLTHLRDPQGTVAAWATQLSPGGLLLLEPEKHWTSFSDRAERVRRRRSEAR
jgi:trans-aconitate methyltransferase